MYSVQKVSCFLPFISFGFFLYINVGFNMSFCFSGKVGIVIGSHSGKIVFLDGYTGIVQWSLSLPDRVESSANPSPCGQYLFVGQYHLRLLS